MTDPVPRLAGTAGSSADRTGSPAAFASMLTWDVRLQHRHGFYAVYALLSVVFVLGLQTIGPGLRSDAAVLLVVAEPTLLGFYFIAAMVLFEKDAGVLDALVVSPLGGRGYLASKVCTLSLLAVLVATVVAVLGHGGATRLWVLVVGVALAAPLFVLLGFVAVARFDSVNAYFISAVGWGTVLFLPLFGYVGLVETDLFYVLPAQPVLLLVEGGFRPLTRLELGYGIGYLLLGNAVAYAWARRSFRRHVVRGSHVAWTARPTVTSRSERADGSRRRTDAFHSPVVGLIRTDVRNWVRDPMMAIAALGPLVLAVVIRFGAPAVTELASSVVALEPYYPVIAGSLAVVGPTIYGFVVGMVVLEDRERGVLAAYRTSPLSDRGYLLYRATTAFVLTFLATVPALAVGGIHPVSPAVLLASAFVGALGGPVLVFTFATLASNTIEGVALSKIVNVAMFTPAVVIAVAAGPAQYLAGVLPSFWPVKVYVAGGTGAMGWPLFVLVGSIVHVLAFAVVARRFTRQLA